MNNQTFDLNKMGVVPMTKTEMDEIVGGNIFKAIGRAASWVWDNVEKIGAALGIVAFEIEVTK